MPDPIDGAVDLSAADPALEGVTQAEPNDPTPREVLEPVKRASAKMRLGLISKNLSLIERRMSRNSFDRISIRWWDEMKEAAAE